MSSRRRLPVLLLLAAALLAAGGCRKPPVSPRKSAEQAILERRKAGLQALLERARRGPLPFNQVLVAIDQSLVQQLITSALPFKRVVNNEYQVTIETVTVNFDDAFALIKLGGRVAMVSRPDTTFADVAVYGALDIVELDPVSGVLRGQVKVVGLDATKVSVLGVVTKTAENLLEEFAGDKVEELGTLFSKLEIPVKLEKEIVIPGFGPDGPVQIKEARIQMSGAVTDVTAYRNRLYVSIGVTICNGGNGHLK